MNEVNTVNARLFGGGHNAQDVFGVVFTKLCKSVKVKGGKAVALIDNIVLKVFL